MASVKIGDRVKLTDREPAAEDVKSGLFYEYFRNLTGVVERVYEDNAVCVDVDLDSLPQDVLSRHREMEITARDKWIAGLSQEQRNRLTARDKQFEMKYKVVVAVKDVQSVKGATGKSSGKAEAAGEPAASPAPRERKAEAPESRPAAVEPAPKPGKKAPAAAPPEESGPKRVTQKDLAAAEREFLKSIKAKQGGSEKQGGASV